jgi:hypothetical protein
MRSAFLIFDAVARETPIAPAIAITLTFCLAINSRKRHLIKVFAIADIICFILHYRVIQVYCPLN